MSERFLYHQELIEFMGYIEISFLYLQALELELVLSPKRNDLTSGMNNGCNSFLASLSQSRLDIQGCLFISWKPFPVGLQPSRWLTVRSRSCQALTTVH